MPEVLWMYRRGQWGGAGGATSGGLMPDISRMDLCLRGMADPQVLVQRPVDTVLRKSPSLKKGSGTG